MFYLKYKIMKAKNLMLGSVAFVLALLMSAFASAPPVINQHISDGALGCRDILDVNCGTAGMNNCLVTVTGAQSNPNIVYENSGCQQPVKTTATSSVGSTSFAQ